MKECKVFLKPKKEESLLRFHPWVFSGAIQTIEGEPEEGDLVEVYGTNGRFLGIGHYQIGSIAVLIFQAGHDRCRFLGRTHPYRLHTAPDTGTCRSGKQQYISIGTWRRR